MPAWHTRTAYFVGRLSTEEFENIDDLSRELTSAGELGFLVGEADALRESIGFRLGLHQAARAAFGVRPAGATPLMAEEHGIVINIEGHLYGVTVEGAWRLREYLPADASGLGASTAVRVRLEQLVYEADELELESPPSRLTKAEKQALYGALCSWLDDVTVDAFPPRMMALRYALYVEDVNDVEFRPVFLAYADGRREDREDVLVTGFGVRVRRAPLAARLLDRAAHARGCEARSCLPRGLVGEA